MACVCPSTHIQIRLIPPEASFLKGSDLLVVAACVPVAFPGFHSILLQGKVVMLGCPKFDDFQAYTDKFAAILKTAGIKSVTTVVMEVPCCAGLPRIVANGLQKAGKCISHYQLTVSTRGNIIENRKFA